MREKIVKFFYYLSLICFIFLIIDGLAPQIEILIFNGYYHRLIRPRVLLFVSLLMIFILRQKIFPPRNILIPYLLLFFYVVMDVFLIHKNMGIEDKFYGIKWYYSTFLIMPLFFYLPQILNEKNVLKIIKYISIPVLMLAFLQIYFNSPIVSTHSVDGEFFVYSLDFAKSIRPFSFFALPGYFSFYVIFLSLIVLCQFNSNSRKGIFLSIFSLLILFFLNYRTTIRAGYIFTIFVLLSIFMYKFGIFKKYWRHMPFFYMTLGFIVVSILFFGADKQKVKYWESYTYECYLDKSKRYLLDMTNESEKESVSTPNLDTTNESEKESVSTPTLDTTNKSEKESVSTPTLDTTNKSEKESMSTPTLDMTYKFEKQSTFLLAFGRISSGDSFAMRLAQWKVCLDIISENWTKFVFGTGYLQSVKGHSIGFPIDNFYINILVHSGIVGLFIFLYFTISFYWFLLKIYESNQNSLNLSVVSFYVSSFVPSFFSGAIMAAFLYSFFVFFLKENKQNIENLCGRNE